MNRLNKNEVYPIKIKPYALALALMWSAIVIASLTWNVYQIRQGTLDVARIQARDSFMKDVVYRRWNAGHGGVYVPVTKETPSNPYLEIPQRDIPTHSGTVLTLINPAYMTRQVHELAAKAYGIYSHITSLNPIRPANAPDPWETQVLQAFQRGANEASLVEEVKGDAYMRLMQPLITEKGCLKCHAVQGYKVGDIRGGISVSVPMSPLWAIERLHIITLSLGHGLLWLVGLAGLGLGTRRLGKQIIERKKAEVELKQYRDYLEEMVKERTAELQQEISERKRAEEALRESEEEYRELVEGTDDLITRVDSEGRFIYVNHVAEKNFGISIDQCIGMSALDFVHPDDREHTQKWFNHIIAMHETRGTIENRQVNKITGEIYDMLWASNFLYDDEGNLTGVNGIARDLTKYKKLEDELFKAKKLESIGILSGGIAHDFNNLLSIIMGNISMTKDDVKPEYGVTDFLNEAEEASLKAEELANQLITFSKGGAPVKKIGSIGELVKETTNFSILGANVKCEFSIPHDLWLVDFDEGQMKHAINNIIVNAVEFMTDSGTIDVKAENFNVSTEQGLPITAGKYIKISIRDQGVGVPAEHLSMVFDPYFSTKEMGIQKGMGLGLTTTYSIINRHDGHITIESERGVGTTFALYLPVYEKDIRELKPVEILKPEKPAIRTGRILVLDDEEMIRNLSRQVLSRLGYEPELVKDGAEAIELYRKAMETGEPFDAVILDLTVKGGMGGKDAVKALLELDPQVKAIVSSGYSNDPVMTNYRAYGFIGALPKPYSKKDLSDMLNQVLGKS